MVSALLRSLLAPLAICAAILLIGCGESGSPASVPSETAAGLTITDTDTDRGELAGDITITRAADETDIDSYVIYWGSDSTTKLGAAIASKPKTGSDIIHMLPADTAIPASATHLLVFTANAVGEMATGISIALVDRYVPSEAAAGIAFTDTDTNEGELGGDITINVAADETDIDSYVIYWGSDSTTKLGAAIATEPKTGSDITYTLPADTAIPVSATHLLVFTVNAVGEMATGISFPIEDRFFPNETAVGVSFSGDTDMDPNQVAGNITISRAAEETDILYYVIYWGSNATTKYGAAIASKPKTGIDIVHTLPANTTKPGPATHILVFTANDVGEMATCVSTAIGDRYFDELLVNGDFEWGQAGYWIQTLGTWDIIGSGHPESIDTYGAWFGGGLNYEDALAQTVAIPADATSATLSFMLFIGTEETSGSYDYLYVRASGNTLLSLDNSSTGEFWTYYEVPLDMYVGLSFDLIFHSTHDASLNTNFFIDDVSLQADTVH